MKRSVKEAFVVVLILALAGALFVVVGPAKNVDAANRADIFVKGETRPMVTKTYPALLSHPPRQGTATVNPILCARDDITYCDQIKLIMAPQGKFFLYSVKVSLSWPAPQRTKENETVDGNDLTLGVWEPNTTTEVPPDSNEFDGKTRGAWTGADYYSHPEVVFVGTDSPDPKTFFLLVNNQSSADGHGPAAVNKGYTIRAEFIETKLEDYPDFKPGSDDTFSYAPPPETKKPAAPITASDFDVPEEGDTVTVKVPGPDGELIDVEIPLVKAAGQSRKAKSSSPVVPIILGLLGLALILFLYFFVWRRRRGEETA